MGLIQRLRRVRVELVAAVLLGLGGVLTAYAANEASGASGEALVGYTTSTRLNTTAAQFAGTATQRYLADQAVWLEYQLMVDRGEADLAAKLRATAFTPELTEVVERWEALAGSDRPGTPLQLEDGYQSTSDRLALLMFEDAERTFQRALEIDERSGRFGNATILFALTLFFAGLASLLTGPRLQTAALGASVLAMVPGVVAIGQGKGWW
jgi:hypothetical protein